jgi:signal transduction histidine kinase
MMIKGVNFRRKSQSVLIVEDDLESVELLKTLFNKKGFIVAGFARNGKDAFEKYKELRPDIVTMDILMPSVDGRASAKKILEFDPQANIVVVSVLGPEELETLKTMGVKALIKKPIDIEELFDAIISISVSIVKDEEGKEMGAVGMARTFEEEAASSGLFIDILRHDMLNPLGIIKNFAELIYDDAPESLIPSVEVIVRNTERLIELVEDASKLSKIEKLKKVNLKRLEVSGLIKQCIEDLTPFIEDKKIVLENNVKDEIYLEANIIIKNAFFNLVSNSIKYSKKGGKVVIDAVERKGLTVSFKDFGPGVKDKYKEAIFDRFEHAKKEGVKGSGIGLTTVKKIVELHGGRVWVEDNTGGGSVFKVKIPKRGSKRY